jgi:5'-3' exonuclease
MLVDTPSLYFRAFHGVPRSVRAPDGTPVNAVRGLLDVLARQLLDLRPRALVSCFDADWRPAFRVELVPSYKAHRVAGAGAGNADVAGPDRDPGLGPVAAGGDPVAVGAGDAGAAAVVAQEEVPDELSPQLPIIDEVLDAFGIVRAQSAGFEADDVIGTLADRHRARGSSGPVEILTGDRDLFQLVRDDVPVRVRYSVEKFAVIDEAAVTARYGVPGRSYGDFAALRGDPSDGLPGVPGVGAKTAAALLVRFGSLDGVLAALETGQDDGFPAGARRRLSAARDYLDRASTVVRVVLDAPVEDLDATLPAVPVDPDRVLALAERWGLASAATRLVRALATLDAGSRR